MGRHAYSAAMRQRLNDLDFRIQRARNRLAEGDLDADLRAGLEGELETLEARRDALADKLEGLDQEPDGTWGRLRGEWEDEWDALQQDFEERIARLS